MKFDMTNKTAFCCEPAIILRQQLEIYTLKRQNDSANIVGCKAYAYVAVC